MQAYQVTAGAGIAGIQRIQLTDPVAGPGQVLVRVHAVSLNYRDLMVVKGTYPKSAEKPVVLATDSAGEVVSVGAGVTRFQPGARVVTTYFPGWVAGRATAEKVAATFGTDTDGVLAELIAVPQDALVKFPEHLSFVEASSLPCVATTAWNTLFEAAKPQTGSTVLLQGTGGFSICALQLAKAAGLRVIITSSSDDKLARARVLGADATINYLTTPEWQPEVLRLTNGEGVDLVAEVGGQGTLSQSLASIKPGGTVAVIGGLSGFGATAVEPFALIGGMGNMAGIYVGSAEMLENALRVYDAEKLRPEIDRVFSFDQAAAAYEYLESGKHFGKIAIQVN
ncbi:NADPH:quinone reductase-like Zn-dependent oxidoreductase [Lysobacter niabensis]|uniref:NADPH:quinone reductase-like Zn-dependent oxidoreductase n=1 Tax=Agrilutibacter niabensis TaxID=380628 RepID=A0ABU1VK08_9GAMM|nr:NAD(P)-dependent alcohol dehydrogenase [Lysobacter niabensis]MDR7097811.1 NADPH:quinone reductase-like Zn-dependent oxidoreductase [Lysobacter niabensis]